MTGSSQLVWRHALEHVVLLTLPDVLGGCLSTVQRFCYTDKAQQMVKPNKGTSPTEGLLVTQTFSSCIYSGRSSLSFS